MQIVHTQIIDKHTILAVLTNGILYAINYSHKIQAATTTTTMRMTKKVATAVCRWRTRQLGTAWHSIGFESESWCNVFVPSMWYCCRCCCCWNSSNVCVFERDSAKVSLSKWNRLRWNCVCAPPCTGVCCRVYVDNFLDFHISVAVVHKLIHNNFHGIAFFIREAKLSCSSFCNRTVNDATRTQILTAQTERSRYQWQICGQTIWSFC